MSAALTQHRIINSNMIIYEYSTVIEISQFKAEFFKALAHPLRIRILDQLRNGEFGVNDLSSRLDVEQSNLSQQLAILRNRNIVATRKEGQNVYYSVRDPELFNLLDVAKKIFNNHLIDVKDLLTQLVVTRRQPARSGKKQYG
jgi:DNA-binding transcriptional ArsR family regulator